MTSGIGGTMKPERSDGSDLRWKRSETKAERKQAERRLTRRHCVEVRRIQGSDSAYFGRFNDRTVVICVSYI